MNRREWIRRATALAGAATTPNLLASAAADKTILLLSGWQTANIGDVAHTPGLLGILELRDEARANRFRSEHGLRDGRPDTLETCRIGDCLWKYLGDAYLRTRVCV